MPRGPILVPMVDFPHMVQFSYENKTFGFWCPVIPGAFLCIKNHNARTLFSLEVCAAPWSNFGAGGACLAICAIFYEYKTFGFWFPVIPAAFLCIKNHNSRSTFQF